MRAAPIRREKRATTRSARARMMASLGGGKFTYNSCLYQCWNSMPDEELGGLFRVVYAQDLAMLQGFEIRRQQPLTLVRTAFPV